jgi:hypothetical protein
MNRFHELMRNLLSNPMSPQVLHFTHQPVKRDATASLNRKDTSETIRHNSHVAYDVGAVIDLNHPTGAHHKEPYAV